MNETLSNMTNNGTRRLTASPKLRRLNAGPPAKPPINLMTHDYDNTSAEDMEDFILGLIIYDIINEHGDGQFTELEMTAEA